MITTKQVLDKIGDVATVFPDNSSKNNTFPEYWQIAISTFGFKNIIGTLYNEKKTNSLFYNETETNSPFYKSYYTPNWFSKKKVELIRSKLEELALNNSAIATTFQTQDYSL